MRWSMRCRTLAFGTSTCRSPPGKSGGYSRRKARWTSGLWEGTELARKMQVKIEKRFEIKEPIEKVWALLSDPTKVVASVPGAKITEKVDDRTYKGSISVKVGPTVTDYKGEVHILNLDPAAHRMEIEGKGQDVRGKGSASMKMTGELTPTADGGTEVITTSEVSVVGLLAQFGGRMINDVSNKVFEEFTKSFRTQLAETPDASATRPGAGQG